MYIHDGGPASDPPSVWTTHVDDEIRPDKTTHYDLIKGTLLMTEHERIVTPLHMWDSPDDRSHDFQHINTDNGSNKIPPRSRNELKPRKPETETNPLMLQSLFVCLFTDEIVGFSISVADRIPALRPHLGKSFHYVYKLRYLYGSHDRVTWPCHMTTSHAHVKW